MSWRATASRPAPPVTSTTADSIFGPSTPSHRPSRNVSGTSSSSSGSAASLLARHMADMDDGASVRSGKSGASGMTVSGRMWDGFGRSRRDSSASVASVATTVRERRSTMGSRTSSNEGDVEAEDGMEMELEDSSSSASSRAERSPNRATSTRGSLPPAGKRQRTNGDFRTAPSTSRASWIAGPSHKSAPAAPTVQTDTSQHLTASPSSAKPTFVRSTHLEPPPLSLEHDTAFPAPPTASRKSSLAFQPAEPTPAASANASLAPQSPTLPPQPAATTFISSRRSWFGRAPVVVEEPEQMTPVDLAHPTEAAKIDADADADAHMNSNDASSTPSTSSTSSTSSTPNFAPSPSAVALVAESSTSQTHEHARQLALQQASASIVSQAGGKGWFSIISRSASTANLTAAAAKEASQSIEEEEASQAMEHVADESEERGGTIKASSSSSTEYNDATVTPRPSRTPVPTVQRASWWGWGGAAEPEVPAEPSVAVEEETVESAEEVAEDEPSPPDEPEPTLAAPVATPAPKSWLTTIWGEFPDEAAARRKVVEAATSAQAQARALTGKTAALAIEQATNSAPADSTDSTSTSVSTTTSSSLDTAPPLAIPPPAAVQALKHQSSWSFFQSRRSSSSTSTLGANGHPSGAGSKLGVASSSASTRSHTSTVTSNGDSAPSSPRLGPQSDSAPLKPLTGSIRNSARPAPYEPDPPFENLVLPTFTDTFERPPRCFPLEKTKLTKAVSVVSSVVSAYLFHQPAPTSPPLGAAGAQERRHMVGLDPAVRLPKSLSVVEEPERLSRVKRVVTIGVHGWFPSKTLKVVFGEPTGTSVKFATMMHDAVQSYLESHNVSSFNILPIALEGHGKIEERVNKLYDQLISRDEWLDALKKADVVFLATHSQGSVASTQLLARMLDQGLIVGSHTHMLAMCGIAQGPFVYLYQSYTLSPYFNYVESEPARELFEFQDPESVPALKFLESLRIILAAGVKLTAIGSINDQVVPLYSSLFSGISHPGILRAVYIDSQAFRTSDFLANLVVFAARLRNAGLQDHDLVYHVSEALAGALTGVGHSKIYEEEEVFNLAVRYAFETTTLAESPTLLDPKAPAPALTMSFNPRDRRNPYLLTWALRGIIEDAQVRELFSKELTALREAFETWKPQTKTLKEVKLKLEGIRMLQRAKDGKL